MKTIVQIKIAAICSCLLIVSVSSVAQTNREKTSSYPKKAALASSDDASARSVRDLASFLAEALPVGELAGSGPFAPRNAAFAFGQGQNNAQEPAKPHSSTEPSLQGLGFPPSEIQGSAKEQALLDKRSHMLQIHQKLGLLTAIPMIAAVFTGFGAKGHHGLPGSPTGRDVHAGLGILTTGMYFTTAYYAIRAPKVPGIKSPPSIRLHKALAWIHGPGMILTPILGSIAFSQLNRGQRVHGIAKYHAAVAYTTAIAYGAAILSVSIK
ncbi:MAG: hypothetical protein ACRD11_07735 [Terriglobia bacterium]